jgi:hypothetical protein
MSGDKTDPVVTGCETERYEPEVRRWRFEGSERSVMSEIAGLGARESNASGLGKDNKSEEPLACGDGTERLGMKRPRAGGAEDGGYIECAADDGPAI